MGDLFDVAGALDAARRTRQYGPGTDGYAEAVDLAEHLVAQVAAQWPVDADRATAGVALMMQATAHARLVDACSCNVCASPHLWMTATFLAGDRLFRQGDA